jgi:hypothetical protein
MSVISAEIEELTVIRRGARYEISSVMLIEAPQALVFEALTDYDQFAALSERYKQSRFEPPARDGSPRIFTQVVGCIWFFCRSIQRYARLDLMPTEEIVAVVEPENSDLRFGLEKWQLLALSHRTRVIYTHTLEPDFWIPPVVGEWALRRLLAKDAVAAAQRIEILAHDGHSGVGRRE